jgi:hypothetical protein
LIVEDQGGLLVQPVEILEQDYGSRRQQREARDFEKVLQGEHGLFLPGAG